MSPILKDRLKLIKRIHLKSGKHAPDSTFCVMEAEVFLHGKPWSDSDEDACPVISTFLRSWNDALPSDADRDRLLKPFLGRIIGTKRDKETEERRSLMAADWLVRVNTPAWMRLAGLTVHADALAALPEITSMTQVPSIRGPLEAARVDAVAAWDAARVAAWVAAWDAAWDAARVAAWDAARVAARVAARDAAWDAARDAARDAAWVAAGKKLAPVVEELQQSAVALIERMIAA